MTRYLCLLALVLLCAGCGPNDIPDDTMYSETLTASGAVSGTLLVNCSRCDVLLPEGRTEGWCDDCVRPEDETLWMRLDEEVLNYATLAIQGPPDLEFTVEAVKVDGEMVNYCDCRVCLALKEWCARLEATQ